mgnify:CR=1 FL=1
MLKIYRSREDTDKEKFIYKAITAAKPCGTGTLAGARDRDRSFLLVHLVVLVAFHGAHHPRENWIPLVGVLGRPGDDQRGAGQIGRAHV